jgi:hypothetical protein
MPESQAIIKLDQAQFQEKSSSGRCDDGYLVIDVMIPYVS